jgi:methionyl-tRNA formyltransferase
MRVILAGQKSFGAAVYDMLQEEGHDVAGVWVNTDDKLFQKTRHLWVPYIERNAKSVQQLEVDLIVGAHSHDFIGRESRQATRLGALGYHPSLLPRHRGRDAVRWTIHLGDAIAGGSVYWFTDSVDCGPIAAQDWCFVPPAWRTSAHPVDGASVLWRQELFPIGVRLLRDVLRDLDNGVIVEIPQDELNATWEPSWERPPLHRPELPQIGSINGYRHITSRETRERL